MDDSIPNPESFPELNFSHLERHAKRWPTFFPRVSITRIVLYHAKNKHIIRATESRWWKDAIKDKESFYENMDAVRFAVVWDVDFYDKDLEQILTPEEIDVCKDGTEVCKKMIEKRRKEIARDVEAAPTSPTVGDYNELLFTWLVLAAYKGALTSNRKKKKLIKDLKEKSRRCLKDYEDKNTDIPVAELKRHPYYNLLAYGGQDARLSPISNRAFIDNDFRNSVYKQKPKDDEFRREWIFYFLAKNTPLPDIVMKDEPFWTLYQREVPRNELPTPQFQKKLRPNQKHREACRDVAEKLWKEDCSISIIGMIYSDELNSILEGKVYAEKTIRNWIKDLCPNRKPGRRPAQK
ncbi:MAG: hypothetical protein JW902_17690 [Syntrophaceae bacterium]|nr:hypothetical protein [Syntrophaceae bacterium]